MSSKELAAEADRCPLCGSTSMVEESTPEPNLYSEKLAGLLGQDEDLVLEAHRNWRCSRCELIFKRRWFPDEVIHELFSGAVGTHPKGWDAIGDRFSPSEFQRIVERWSRAVAESPTPQSRRAERELLSIVDAIPDPVDFDRGAVRRAIRGGDVAGLDAAAASVAASIRKPAAFTRFTGFWSQRLWDYLQSRTGGFDHYAELGCPLWGLLPLAAANGVGATYLARAEINYWGEACTMASQHCSARLLSDPRVGSSQWADRQRYPVVGVFQYLDHLTAPERFLRELFDKADSAAVILDAMDSPLAVQHVTGWTKACLAYVARLHGRHLHSDFDDIRDSGNRLYLLTKGR